MELAIQVLLGLVTFICLAGGSNLLFKGAGAFLPNEVPPQRLLDNIFRFISAIYFSLGFLLAWIVFHISEIHELIYFIGIVVFFAGIGRWYSRIKVGSAGKYTDFIMLFEIVLGLVIIVLQFLR